VKGQRQSGASSIITHGNTSHFACLMLTSYQTIQKHVKLYPTAAYSLMLLSFPLFTHKVQISVPLIEGVHCSVSLPLSFVYHTKSYEV